MSDLYPILLKNTEQVQFGANPINTVMLKSKGKVVMGTKKLLVTYNGEIQEPLDCQSVMVKFEGDTISLDIVLEKEKENEKEKEQIIKDVPQTEAVIPAATTDTFILQGDDLEAFELLSNFQRAENLGQKTENIELVEHTLESGIFNIQDLTSVQNAMLDLVEKEKQFIDQGYKVFKANTPKFDYENNTDFKLIEFVVLIKQPKQPKIVNNKTK